MQSKDVLFIVEGESTEPKLLKKINTILKLDADINIYSYKTSIYELYDELKFDDDLDVTLLLREKESRKRQRNILSKNFVAVYLVFDFEPHYQKFDVEKIKKMNTFFNDSLDKGLLLINFPMVEAVRHLKAMPDKEFMTRTVNKNSVNRYKELVGKESTYTDFEKYNFEIVVHQIIHHFIKLNYLVNNVKILPDPEEALDMINSDNLINIQYNAYTNDEIYVLSTVYYYLLELKSSSFYDQLQLPIIDELCNE